MLKLYYMPGTSALASHIALAEAGAKYEIEKVDFTVSQQKSADYLKLNPKGRVPVLQTPDGMLTETPAILAYIAETHPRAGLIPANNPFEFARCQAFNSYFCSTVHIAHAHRMRGSRWADDPDAIAAMQRKVPESVFDSFVIVEEALVGGPWLLGKAYSICDPYLFTLSGWLEADGVDPRRLPRVVEHRQRMQARASVQRALAEQGL
jgi:glutathione S-transferase